MAALLSEITGRQKAFLGLVASVDDFTVGSSQEVRPDIVLSSKAWSLYSIDFARDRAVFVELPTETDLGSVPFAYMAQFEQARRVVSLPIDQLVALSAQVTLPPHFGILFSTGRCGSTLASHILAKVPGVWSLSEPDVLTSLAFARFDVPQERMVPLIAATTRLLFAPPSGRTVETFVIKPRSEAMLQAPVYALALPEARNVFMYRDAIGYVNSLYQFVQKLLGPETFFQKEAWKIGWQLASVNSPYALLDRYFPNGWEDIGFPEQMLISWLLRIDAYMAALQNGTRMQPLHYKDLNTSREQETAHLLAAFGISTEHVRKALSAFDRDSQEGTGAERERTAIPLDQEQIQRLCQLMLQWGKQDFVEARLPMA